MKHKTQTLDGVLLDAAIAKSEGLEYEIYDNGFTKFCRVKGHPWTVVEHGEEEDNASSVIDERQVSTACLVTETGTLEWFAWVGAFGPKEKRITPPGCSSRRVAAMRAVAVLVFGEEVDL